MKIIIQLLSFKEIYIISFQSLIISLIKGFIIENENGLIHSLLKYLLEIDPRLESILTSSIEFYQTTSYENAAAELEIQ